MSYSQVSPLDLRQIMMSKEEYALIDVREQGVHSEGHPFLRYLCHLAGLSWTSRDYCRVNPFRFIFLIRDRKWDWRCVPQNY